MTSRFTPYSIGSPRDCLEMAGAIRHSEPIRYSQNGNRAFRARDFLKRAEKIAVDAGLTRVAEISQLVDHSFSVFQAARPSIHSHFRYGQNTGGQGKGFSKTQAKISCLMETIEQYCAEPAAIEMIRGSYQYLRTHHQIHDPRRFGRCLEVEPVRLTEPLMWWPALDLKSGKPRLIPAETVFMPFHALDFGTRPIFPISTNGLASGATFLEAIIHALYEVIERAYYAAFEADRLRLREIAFSSVAPILNARMADVLSNEMETRLYSLEFDGIKNLPMIACYIQRGADLYSGLGCSGDLRTSVTRAVSEAMQSVAIYTSGAREDIGLNRGASLEGSSAFPEVEKVQRQDLRVYDQTFSDLRTEYRFILRWLSRLGFSDVLVANLTRAGIGLPVVRAVVPGLPLPIEERTSSTWTSSQINEHKYQFTGSAYEN